MKAYFINGRYDGCWYVRQYLPMLHNGWDGNKTSPFTEQADNMQAYKGAMASDVVVFHRPDQANKAQVIPLLKMAGKKVVVDNDDTYIPDSGTPVSDLFNHEDLLQKINENLNYAIQHADLVTVTTDFLAREYGFYNDNVVVLPNYVDPADWGPVEHHKNDKIRIGLVGSVVSTHDFYDIKPFLKEISEDDRYQLVVMGLPPDSPEYSKMNEIYKEEKEFWLSLNVEWHPFVRADEYIAKLKELRMDIALIPREDNYFNKCKSNLKFLEMSMLGVPCIASGWKDNPYEKDRKHIYLPNTLKGWKSALKKLTDGKTRRDRGMSARMYVESKYDIKKHAKKWEETYKSLIN